MPGKPLPTHPPSRRLSLLRCRLWRALSTSVVPSACRRARAVCSFGCRVLVPVKRNTATRTTVCSVGELAEACSVLLHWVTNNVCFPVSIQRPPPLP